MQAMDRFFQTAWQPFTPRGVARFASASFGRLLVVQLIVALLAAAVVTWCVRTVWFPVVREAIQNLPEHGQVRSGRLQWVGASPQALGEGRCLALAVDLDHSGEARGASHVSLELGTVSVRVYSLFGYVEMPYPAGWAFALNRPEVSPWWGAWSPVILLGVFGGTMATLLASWAVLALAYCVPVWLLGRLLNRELCLRGAWRLCGAAQMPGALCLTVALVSYGLGWFDPLRLLVAFGAHLVVSWVCLVMAPLALSSVQTAVQANPFAGVDDQTEVAKLEKPRKENPFGGGER